MGVGDEWSAVVLVGRHGGARFRSGEPVPAPDLFTRIDPMPMRRREMREKRRDEGFCAGSIFTICRGA